MKNCISSASFVPVQEFFDTVIVAQRSGVLWMTSNVNSVSCPCSFFRSAADAVLSLLFAAAVVVAVVVYRPPVVWCNCSGGIGRLVCAYVVKCKLACDHVCV